MKGDSDRAMNFPIFQLIRRNLFVRLCAPVPSVEFLRQ